MNCTPLGTNCAALGTNWPVSGNEYEFLRCGRGLPTRPHSPTAGLRHAVVAVSRPDHMVPANEIKSGDLRSAEWQGRMTLP